MMFGIFMIMFIMKYLFNMLGFLKKLFSIEEGSQVRIISNVTNHSLKIGDVYTVDRITGQVSGYNPPRSIIYIHDQVAGCVALYLEDIELVTDKDYIIDELKDIIEFLKDNDLTNRSEKDYKIFRLLKTIKGEKTDMDKIKILSKYI